MTKVKGLSSDDNVKMYPSTNYSNLNIAMLSAITLILTSITPY